MQAVNIYNKKEMKFYLLFYAIFIKMSKSIYSYIIIWIPRVASIERSFVESIVIECPFV